ncbi:hypothetical protein ACFOG5_21260 [Pedobacter fastidiosus]|uniref:DUF3575 domain-containing protein n=1 Tax=Pedobacter fastidiosus TaxID=2765361 RepID=A0ABR7KNS4_9SPHI|nr:hypothetical protein [Pedobacter fastidiosus]MBC6109722.1 hypothetical protein [Pedobacter fastidiosus]
MKLTLLSIFLMFSVHSIAQDESSPNKNTKKNSIYIEALGNAIVYSVNYDRIIPISNHLKLAPRVGFEFLPRTKRNNKTFGEKYGNWSFPLELNLLWGKDQGSKNLFEGGIGLGFFSMIKGYTLDQNEEISTTHYQMAKISTLRLGYRHQKPEGGLMYRAGLLIRLSQDDFSKSRVGDDLFYVLWPAFSVGYTF